MASGASLDNVRIYREELYLLGTYYFLYAHSIVNVYLFFSRHDFFQTLSLLVPKYLVLAYWKISFTWRVPTNFHEMLPLSNLYGEEEGGKDALVTNY